LAFNGLWQAWLKSLPQRLASKVTLQQAFCGIFRGLHLFEDYIEAESKTAISNFGYRNLFSRRRTARYLLCQHRNSGRTREADFSERVANESFLAAFRSMFR